MAMEKRGVVDPSITPPNEPQQQQCKSGRCGCQQKQAGDKQARTDALDDDFTKRAASAMENGLKSGS